MREPARHAGQREQRLQTVCKRLQRHNRHTCGGAAKGSRVGWYRRRCVLRHPHHCPRTILSWLLAKWVVGESEEAERRTLSSHGPENPEEKENCSFLKKVGKQKQKILLPALHQGKERRCFRRLLRKSKFQHLRVARVRAASSTSWTTWGLAGMREVPLSCERLDAPAKVSIRPGAEQLWRMQEGAHGNGQTEAWPRGQQWMVHHAGAGVLDRLGLLLYRRELLGKPSMVSLNSPAWEMGASRKCASSTSLISTRLSQRWRSWTTMVDIAFPRDRAVTFVARRAKSVAVHSSCINFGSVLPSCTCLSALAW